jgi:hypothetical protein
MTIARSALAITLAGALLIISHHITFPGFRCWDLQRVIAEQLSSFA